MQETDGKFSLFSLLLFILYLLAFIPVAAFAELGDIPHIPHVAGKAEVSFEFYYLYAAPHRAFAIVPGGAWTWQSGKETTEMAKQGALAACKQYSQQKCVLFAVDNDIVFDTKSWSSLWGTSSRPPRSARRPTEECSSTSR